MIAPRPTAIGWENVLLFSIVSAMMFVASAVAVSGVEPFTAVQFPTVTLTVAPAAIAGVLALLSVVAPISTRVVVPAATPVVPRLLTKTLKETEAPAVGLCGFILTPTICRSGPGAWTTVICEAAVKALLPLLGSLTRLAGSTVAAT